MWAVPGPNGGRLVNKVDPYSSAWKAGIKENDEVLAFGEQKAESPEVVIPFLNSLGPGKMITVKLLRDGQPIELNMKLLRAVNMDIPLVGKVLERKLAPAKS
jgi:S1-C subfamily serine protease